jgi:hypothetical protein
MGCTFLDLSAWYQLFEEDPEAGYYEAECRQAETEPDPGKERTLVCQVIAHVLGTTGVDCFLV